MSDELEQELKKRIAELEGKLEFMVDPNNQVWYEKSMNIAVALIMQGVKLIGISNQSGLSAYMDPRGQPYKQYHFHNTVAREKEHLKYHNNEMIIDIKEFVRCRSILKKSASPFDYYERLAAPEVFHAASTKEESNNDNS